MAFDDQDSGASAALAIRRLTRNIESLQSELDQVTKAVARLHAGQLLEKAKPPIKGLKGDKGDRGPKGLKGDKGDEGPRGKRGPPGGSSYGGGVSPIPTGGSTGQVLAKASDSSRDVHWVNQSGGAASLSGVSDATTGYVFPTSDPQLEGAVNALGAKINEIIDALS